MTLPSDLLQAPHSTSLPLKTIRPGRLHQGKLLTVGIAEHAYIFKHCHRVLSTSIDPGLLGAFQQTLFARVITNQPKIYTATKKITLLSWYSDERYRVLSLNVHKTKYNFYANFTIADNVTRTNSENELVEAWVGRERGADKVSQIHIIDSAVYDIKSMVYIVSCI